MGRYFGREPRYSREEIEGQAKQAIEAQVSQGRPPEDDWRPLDARMAELDREAASRPQPELVPEPRPVPAPVGATTPPA
ncbi:MAG: hypothetical protein M3066_10200 [Actinomycetota bacterium]|nr:hypothetical protein [Actinomycetota bacterium]